MDASALLDRQQIAEVVMRYARGADRRDFELMRSCFHPDAGTDYGSVGGVDEVIAAAESLLPGYTLTYHLVGNILAEVDGDVARVETYTIATHRSAQVGERRGKDDIWGIRYVDRFERRGGEWRIAHRVVVHEWRRVAPLEPAPGG